MLSITILLPCGSIIDALLNIPEFELYDASDPNYILASREDILYLINEKVARIKRASAVLEMNGTLLRQERTRVCSDGMSGNVSRICKLSDVFSQWKLQKVPNVHEHYELKNWDESARAVYESTIDNGKRDIGIGSCPSDDLEEFKIVGMHDYLTQHY